MVGSGLVAAFMFVSFTKKQRAPPEVAHDLGNRRMTSGRAELLLDFGRGQAEGERGQIDRLVADTYH